MINEQLIIAKLLLFIFLEINKYVIQFSQLLT